MKQPNRIEIAKRIVDVYREWKYGNRIFPEDIVCKDEYDPDEEVFYLQLSRPQYENYISFTVGEISDIAQALSDWPELIKLTCCSVNSRYGHPMEIVTLSLDIEIMKQELITETCPPQSFRWARSAKRLPGVQTVHRREMPLGDRTVLQDN